MTISEMVKKLEKLKAKHGDISVAFATDENLWYVPDIHAEWFVEGHEYIDSDKRYVIESIADSDMITKSKARGMIERIIAIRGRQ